ncbi:glutathione S-transferase family protein [Ottowia sp. GY511]|uniref:Glutathione S-transferase family protein n=1 Tax=Ottowia flava TaxID=2675430 RepID=A0ABW4KUH0_9BURK|nr:glutathione S-transferase family protein [Ottowia sp. GY511]TXK33503.1 glutathione S-transferase family protein [Ottowia sp. GY511]
MRLYHHPLSSNARRAVMAALHLAPRLPEPVELVLVDLAQGEHRQPDFLRLNPQGKVPVLVDGDFVLTESHAIMEYLVELAPGQTLWPADVQARADVNRWMFWSAQHLMPPVGVLNWERFVKGLTGGGAPDAARIAAGEAECRAALAALDRHLNGRTWVAGDALSLADLALAAPLMHAQTARLPLGGLPHLAAWAARVQALPAWQQTEG